METVPSEEQIQRLLAKIETMLRDPTCIFDWRRGMRRIDNWETGWVEFVPMEGETMIIKVRGGAV